MKALHAKPCFTAREHFRDSAAYNAWANARHYDDVARLSPEAVKRDIGLYFGSLFATLVHILQTDHAWMFLLRGGALGALIRVDSLDTLAQLSAKRRQCDDELIGWIDALNADDLAERFEFTSGLGDWNGMTYSGTRQSTLTHLFNHQTHHRGQAHAALTILGIAEPKALDLLVKGFLAA